MIAKGSSFSPGTNPLVGRWWESPQCWCVNLPPEVTNEDEAVCGYLAMMMEQGLHVVPIYPTEPGYADVIGDLFLLRLKNMPPYEWELLDAARGKVCGPRGVWTMRLFWSAVVTP